MNFPVMVALITLASLFAVFHSCLGLQCYLCHSENFGIKNCDKIVGDEFLHDYGDQADVCTRVLLQKNGTKKGKRLIYRLGFMDADRAEIDDLVTLHRESDYKVSWFTCKDDKCNRK